MGSQVMSAPCPQCGEDATVEIWIGGDTIPSMIFSQQIFNCECGCAFGTDVEISEG